MTPPPRQLSHLRAILIFWTLILAFVTPGCWEAALQLAPLGEQVLGAVASGATNLIGSAVVSHAAKDKSRNPDEDDIDREEKCDNLLEQPPGVIEIGSNTTGVAQYRDLRLGGSPDQPRWEPYLDKDAGPAGWRPATNISNMKFSPPLSTTDPAYLAYSAAEPQTASEEDGLNSLNSNFGIGAGTFNWKGRPYEYAVVRKLPCYPPPT